MIAQEAKKHKLTAQIGQERGKQLHQFVGNSHDCTRSQKAQISAFRFLTRVAKITKTTVHTAICRSNTVVV